MRTLKDPLQELEEDLISHGHIGWFGFSADPPTRAHAQLVEAVASSQLVDQVVIFPAGKLSYKSFQASDAERLEMTRLWLSKLSPQGSLLLSDFDLRRSQAINWYDLWQTFKDPNRHFLIVGSDQYMDIAVQWHRGSELLEKATFLVVPRKGSYAQLLQSHHVMLDVEPVEGSSTDCRSGDLSLVDESVRDYIISHDLYSDSYAH